MKAKDQAKYKIFEWTQKSVIIMQPNYDYFYNQKDNFILNTAIDQRLQVLCSPGSLLDSKLWAMERKYLTKCHIWNTGYKTCPG